MVVIKGFYGASGDDITFWPSKQEIAERFGWKTKFKLVAIEENLKVNTDCKWVGCQWYDNVVKSFC